METTLGKKFDVYGIGNAIVDLQVLVDESELAELQLNKGSMQLVNLEEQAQLLAALDDLEVHHSSGGAAANSMIAIAQLGGSAAYGCVVGDDERGEYYIEEMKVLGVTITNGPVTGQPTGTSVIVVTPDGERTMNTHLGATAQFGPKDLNLELLNSSQWLFVEGYLFTSESGQQAIEKAIIEAKKYGVKIAVTYGDSFIPEVFSEPVQAATAKADLVIANFREALALTGCAGIDEAFHKLAGICPRAIVTLSEHGAWVSWEGENFRVPAVKTHVTDATGAGDMFAGAFLYGITHSLSPKHSTELGCLMASKVVNQLGARLKGNAKEISKEILA